MIHFEGCPVSRGVAAGRTLVYHPYVPQIGQREYAATPAERFRLCCEAIDRAREELRRLAERLDAEASPRADVMRAHYELVDDPALAEELELASETMQPDVAIHTVCLRFADMLCSVDDPCIRERAADYADISRRLIRVLEGAAEVSLSSLSEPCIIVADELLPSDTVAIDRKNVLGILTVKGAETSHMAIIARDYGIPAISGLQDIDIRVETGDMLVLDARELRQGHVFLRPDEETLHTYRMLVQEERQTQEREQAALRGPARTKDGIEIDVLLNLSVVKKEDLETAPFSGGVGLFRTEFLYLEGDQQPSEENQYQCYRQVLDAFAGKPVTMRTLDVGGDKELPCLQMPREDNPFLGKRGLRLCLELTDVLQTQLKAALRAAAHGNLNIMFPMVTCVEDIQAAAAMVEQARKELNDRNCEAGPIRLGVMVEVPALALISNVVARYVDFVSIGTNDLCQYLTAADRTNPEVAHWYQSFHPAVLRMIQQVADSFIAAGKEVSVCGELAGNPLATELLVGLGIRKLSVSAGTLGRIKQRLSEFTIEQAEHTAREALELESADAVMRLLEEKCRQERQK